MSVDFNVGGYNKNRMGHAERKIKMKKYSWILCLLLMVGLVACKGEEKKSEEAGPYVSAGVNQDYIKQSIPDFTPQDAALISSRLTDEAVKVKGLEGKEGKELTEIREQLFREKQEEIFKGYDFSQEEIDAIAKESYLGYVMDNVSYTEEGHHKLEVRQEDLQRAKEQEAEQKQKEEEGFHVYADFPFEKIQSKIPEFTLEESEVLSWRLTDELEKMEDLQGKQGKELTELREKILKDKEKELFKGLSYYNQEEKDFICSQSSIGYKVDGTEYRE